MIDQNVLYSDCPCGSGKKFKFCCYPSVRSILPKNPTAADVTGAIRRRSQEARLAEQSGATLVLDLERFHELIGRGLGYLQDRRFKDAKEEFLKAKKEFGMLPTAYNNLALCALVQGKLKEAEEWTQEAIRKFPVENPFGMAIAADIRYLKGDLVGALDIIGDAEKIVPPSVDQAARLCESMAHFKDHRRILEYVEKSGFKDDPEVALFRGIALANLGQSQEAERSLRIAVRGRQGDYAERILDDLVNDRRPSTICGDWMYFRSETFTLFGGLANGLDRKDAQQVDLSAEVISELIEVTTNDGLVDVESAIETLASTMSKRSERMLDALRSDMSRPESVRKAAAKAYMKLFGKNKLGERLRDEQTGTVQQMIITEEAVTHNPLAPEYEENYFKAVRICLNPKSTPADLKEASRLLEDLYDKVPDNPAVANNYASALSRTGRIAKAVEVTSKCFAQHPEYVFGAANYLNILLMTRQMDEAKAMIENYRLPQRIHPDAYEAWCRPLMRYYELVGNKECLENTKKSLELIRKQLRRG